MLRSPSKVATRFDLKLSSRARIKFFKRGQTTRKRTDSVFTWDFSVKALLERNLHDGARRWLRQRRSFTWNSNFYLICFNLGPKPATYSSEVFFVLLCSRCLSHVTVSLIAITENVNRSAFGASTFCWLWEKHHRSHQSPCACSNFWDIAGGLRRRRRKFPCRSIIHLTVTANGGIDNPKMNF